MVTSVDDTKQKNFAYPNPIKGPDIPYSSPPKSNNPVLRGIPLLVVAFLASKLDFIAAYLWRNAGFDRLRTIKELDNYEPRYDPTVIPSSPANDSVPLLESFFDTAASFNQEVAHRHYSIADYHIAYKSGKVSPTSVAHTILDLINPTSEHASIFIDIRRTQLLAAAAASTQRFKDGTPLGLLDGVPVAVKDEVDLSGCKTTLGSANDFTRPDGRTSWCVQQWEDAGAVILGKLNMHELGFDTTNNNPTYGTPPNPHSPHHYPGGSSGGSASALSLGLIPIALGADGGGSIRIPASYCGITGLKPTHGRVSTVPTPSLAPSVGVVGPMATNIADLAIGYKFMATPDPRHPSSSLFPPPTTAPRLQQRPSQLPRQKLIGIYDPWFSRASPSVLSVCTHVLDRYKARGWTVVPISIPFLTQGQSVHALTILNDISSLLPSLPFTPTPTNDTPLYKPANTILLSVARQTPSSDLLLAQKLRQLLMQHLASLFKQYPGMIIVTPTTPDAGRRIEKRKDLEAGVSDADQSLRSMEFVWVANFAGCPALSMPAGWTEEEKEGRVRLPVGLMGMGEWGNEGGVLGWGCEGEEMIGEEGEEKGDWRPPGWADVLGWAAEREKKGRMGEEDRDEVSYAKPVTAG